MTHAGDCTSQHVSCAALTFTKKALHIKSYNNNVLFLAVSIVVVNDTNPDKDT